MKFIKILKGVASFVYPPIGLLGVHKSLVRAPDNFRDTIEKNSEDNKYSEDQAKIVFEWAKIIYESESKRKETIENKAQSYLVGLSIATGIIAVIPFLFSDRWSLPSNIAVLVAILFTAAVFFMLTAGFFSLKTRQVGSFSLPGADLFSKQFQENAIDHLKNSSLLISYAKNNEAILTEKSNYLYVAEMSFVRGIFLVMVSIILAVSGKLYASPIKTTNKSIQEIRLELGALKNVSDVNRINIDDQSKKLITLQQASKDLEKELVHIQEKAEKFDRFSTRICTWVYELRPPFYGPLHPNFSCQ